MSACKNCIHFSGTGEFLENRVPKILTLQEAEWFAPLKCRDTPVRREEFDRVNDTMVVWTGYAAVHEVNTTYGKICPKFTQKTPGDLGSADPDIKP